MNTPGAEKSRPTFQAAAALAVIGLYLAGLIRLAISGDWHDVAASHLLGLAGVGAGALVLVSVALRYRRPEQPWTARRRTTAFSVLGLILAGGITSLALPGTGWGSLLLQTAMIGAMLFLVMD